MPINCEIPTGFFVHSNGLTFPYPEVQNTCCEPRETTSKHYSVNLTKDNTPFTTPINMIAFSIEIDAGTFVLDGPSYPAPVQRSSLKRKYYSSSDPRNSALLTVLIEPFTIDTTDGELSMTIIEK